MPDVNGACYNSSSCSGVLWLLLKETEASRNKVQHVWQRLLAVYLAIKPTPLHRGPNSLFTDHKPLTFALFTSLVNSDLTSGLHVQFTTDIRYTKDQTIQLRDACPILKPMLYIQAVDLKRDSSPTSDPILSVQTATSSLKLKAMPLPSSMAQYYVIHQGYTHTYLFRRWYWLPIRVIT